jgi:putative transposase
LRQRDMMEHDDWDISVSPHRPLHWYSDQGCYWITAATYHHVPHFRADTRKERFVAELLEAAEAWQVDLVGWTLIEQHYRAILRVEHGRSLTRFLGRLHGRTAAFVNREDGTAGREVWHQYWDTLVHSEGDFWCRINYMWWNPVKHGFCHSPEEWRWTNLTPLMTEMDDETRAAAQRFPAPKKLPGDEW